MLLPSLASPPMVPPCAADTRLGGGIFKILKTFDLPDTLISLSTQLSALKQNDWVPPKKMLAKAFHPTAVFSLLGWVLVG